MYCRLCLVCVVCIACGIYLYVCYRYYLGHIYDTYYIMVLFILQKKILYIYIFVLDGARYNENRMI